MCAGRSSKDERCVSRYVMSFPSLVPLSAAHGIDVSTATEEALHPLFLEAFDKDLPLGWQELLRLVRTLPHSGQVAQMYDHRTPLGRQVLRLAGTSVARAVCAGALEVQIGFYTPCTVVLAREQAALTLSVDEQLRLWGEAPHGDLAEHAHRRFHDAWHTIEGFVAEEGLFHAFDPKSPLGTKLTMLLASDVTRAAMERRFGVRLAFLNCCAPVKTPGEQPKPKLAQLMRLQIGLQGGGVPAPDC